MSKDKVGEQKAIDDNVSSLEMGGNRVDEAPLSQNHHDLLNDISMDLTVEIGRAKIKISELLNLSKGTIVHLDQQADEPLNIYANDKLIAKGHIISANGKYSIRVI